MVTFLISRCRERNWFDWSTAIAVDLLTGVWIGLLIAWAL
jgi:hypothetical protein